MSSAPNRTRELSFERPDGACVSRFLETGVVVLKKSSSKSDLDAARTPYVVKSTLTFPLRALAKGVAETVGRESALYRAIHPGYVRAHPQHLPRYMLPAKPVVDGLVALNDALFEDKRLCDKYNGKKELNLIGIQRSSGRTSVAFPKHQDSQGVTGIGYATQGQYTKWNIYDLSQANVGDAEPAYAFYTDVGDTVVLAERAGECPDYIPPRQGEGTVFEDGSVIHEGWNLALPRMARYAIVAFCEELPEGVRRAA